MGDTNRTTNYSAHIVSVCIRVEVADAAAAAAKHKTQYKYEKHKIKCKLYTSAHFFIILLALLYLL